MQPALQPFAGGGRDARDGDKDLGRAFVRLGDARHVLEEHTHLLDGGEAFVDVVFVEIDASLGETHVGGAECTRPTPRGSKTRRLVACRGAASLRAWVIMRKTANQGGLTVRAI